MSGLESWFAWVTAGRVVDMVVPGLVTSIPFVVCAVVLLRAVVRTLRASAKPRPRAVEA